MTYDVRPIRVNDLWRQVLIVTTETEQNFDQSSFTETLEEGSHIYVATYVVEKRPFRHFAPGHDSSNPDSHKYWFFLLEHRVDEVENAAAVQAEEAAQILLGGESV